MNNQLTVKMSKIEKHFDAAGVKMPATNNRYEIIPVKCGGSKGIQVKNIAVWGVSPKEYWAYLKSHK